MARYIDADVLKEELKMLTIFVTGMLCGKTHLTEVVAEYKKSLFKLIDEQPDVDVVPRSEGEWIHSEFDDDAECSACGKAPYDFKFPLQNPDMARYCPYCGAKMRGVNYGNLLTWDEMKGGAE